MNLSRSTYYRHPDRNRAGERARLEAQHRAEIEAILEEFPAYGYRRVSHELRRRGTHVNHKRIARIMRNSALTPRRVGTFLAITDSGHEQPVFPNLLDVLTPMGPDQVWLADLTYLRLSTGFLYLAVILDAWSRRVVGYAISHLLDTCICLAALEAALEERKPSPGLVHHSDRGVQGRTQPVVATLTFCVVFKN